RQGTRSRARALPRSPHQAHCGAAREDARSDRSALQAAALAMVSDEYVLDTHTVRRFVASVRGAIAAAASPAEACDTIRPLFADLLADDAWLPDHYAAA